MKNSRPIIFCLILFLVGSGVLAGKPILTAIGDFLVKGNNGLSPADAAVVLTTGVDYPARLIAAATLYKKGLAAKIVINGGRKSTVMKQLEEHGYNEPCHWSANSVGVLKFLDVPARDIIVLDVPDAYDTISEAAITGSILQKQGLRKLIITTSKFHSRRAGHIWRTAFAGIFAVQVAAAGDDPFRPDSWWTDGRQVRQLLAEYGAWLYYWAFTRT